MPGNVRWMDYTDAEKKQVLRIRNTESSRKNRRKWKEQDNDMKAIYDSNEQRIQQLENMVLSLSSELKNGSRSSATSSTSTPSSYHNSSHSSAHNSSRSSRKEQM